MPIIAQHDQDILRKRFDLELKRNLDVTLYTKRDLGGLYIPGRECRTCGPTEQLLEEVSALSPKIHLETVDFYGNLEDAKARGIEKIPAIIIHSEGGDNARIYGMPTGFEFPLLLDSMIAATTKQSSLQLETRRRLKRLKEDVHIQVFVTPSCKFCPSVARLAHAMALESPRVVADVVEIQEFPQQAQLYRVMGVPRTVINDSVQFTGAVSEDLFLRRVLEAVGEETPEEGVEDRISEQTTLIR